MALAETNNIKDLVAQGQDDHVEAKGLTYCNCIVMKLGGKKLLR